MPKLTMDDVDKKIEELLAPPAKRPDVMRDLLDRVRGGAARLPKPPKLPPIGEPKL